MSAMDNIILHMSLDDAAAGMIEQVNRFFGEPPFIPLDGIFEGAIYLATPPHTRMLPFLQFLRRLTWQGPHILQVIERGAHDCRFDIFNIFGDEESYMNPAEYEAFRKESQT